MGEWTVAGAGGELFSETLTKMPTEALEQRQQPLRSQPPSSRDGERRRQRETITLHHRDQSSSDSSDPLPPFLVVRPVGFPLSHLLGSLFRC